MRNYTNTITGTKCNVSANGRKRSVVTVVYTQGLLRALDDARFLLAWLLRPVLAAHAVVQRHAVTVAAGATAMSEPGCSGSLPSRMGLGGPGSRLPSGRF